MRGLGERTLSNPSSNPSRVAGRDKVVLGKGSKGSRVEVVLEVLKGESVVEDGPVKGKTG